MVAASQNHPLLVGIRNLHKQTGVSVGIGQWIGFGLQQQSRHRYFCPVQRIPLLPLVPVHTHRFSRQSPRDYKQTKQQASRGPVMGARHGRKSPASWKTYIHTRTFCQPKASDQTLTPNQEAGDASISSMVFSSTLKASVPGCIQSTWPAPSTFTVRAPLIREACSAGTTSSSLPYSSTVFACGVFSAGLAAWYCSLRFSKVPFIKPAVAA